MRCGGLELRELARLALLDTDPDAKLAAVAAIGVAVDSGGLHVDPGLALEPVDRPGRPARPLLVEPRAVPKRKLSTASGRAALVHAVAHIEFNAINLALDAVARFADLPAPYYFDWIQVAREEALHYRLLAAHLHTLGHRYGDFDAHDGLWEAAAKTADDPLARMGLVPRILEARGLDVTPGMQSRLRAVGAEEIAAILDIILRDEIGHVAIGNRWYRHLCAERGFEPVETFSRLLRRYGVSAPRPPFNIEARLAAGFDAAELDRLAAQR